MNFLKQSLSSKGVKINWECNKNLLNRKSQIPIKETLLFPKGIEEFVINEVKQSNALHEKICFQSGNFENNKGRIEFAYNLIKGKLSMEKHSVIQFII